METCHTKDALKRYLIATAKEVIPSWDPSHDLDHALRVLANAEYIANCEGGDRETIIPAALLHDAVVYPKNDPRAEYAADESAEHAKDILEGMNTYPKHKIAHVKEAIREHSFSKGVKPTSLESMIVQDADRLEATGAVAIMRTFCSSGQMQRQFYHTGDPFCEEREPGFYALDLFYKRLLQVKESMNTATARDMAHERTRYLHDFLTQVRHEIRLPYA